MRRFLVAAAPGLLLVACAPPPPEPDAGASPPPAVTGGRVQSADGVSLVYDAVGSGPTAVVFVHCWACNRGFWRHQITPVADAGYRVVTLDLPGHGDSGANRPTWSMDGLAADVHAVIDALDLDRVVLVGHSMGGPVSLAAARRMPGRVIGVACVDTLHNAEFEWPAAAVEEMVGQLQADYRAGMESFVPQLFTASADPALVRWVIDQAIASDHEATIAVMRGFPEVDMRALFRAAGVPIRCINAAPAGQEGFPTAVEINRKYADFSAVLMQDVGHYPQLERPDEFNARLLEVLDELSEARR